MSLEPLLLGILVCPEDKQSLWYLEDEDALVNLRLRRRYVIRDGIPVLLVEEAEALDDAEIGRISEKVANGGVLTGPPATCAPADGPPATGPAGAGPGAGPAPAS